MRCETCQGSGQINGGARYDRQRGLILIPIACETCGGSGISHCCDGIQEQRDPGDETAEECKNCRGYGIANSLLFGNDAQCPYCGGSGKARRVHENPIIDALLTEASDAALETLWADQLGQMERDVTGLTPIEQETAERLIAEYRHLNSPTGCADDCCHPSHRHDKPNALVEAMKRGAPVYWEAIGEPTRWPAPSDPDTKPCGTCRYREEAGYGRPGEVCNHISMRGYGKSRSGHAFYFGKWTHEARREGGLCGPSGQLWEMADAHDEWRKLNDE